MENSPINCRVLSIQSHVVCGYVGNRSACFPLQVLGLDVDFINTVQLSNHTGYKFIKGQKLNADELQDLFDGLKLNDLHNYTHILTGYIGTVSFLTKMVEIIREMKAANPDLYFVCDPVMGDNKKMYVPEEVIPIYKDQLVPMADIVTPNQFETELITGITINTEEDVMKAMDILHGKGVKSVVISSTEIGEGDTLFLYGSFIKDGKKTMLRMAMPKLPAVFTGTGDLFTALLLAWMSKTGGDLKISCEKAINTMQSVLKRTLSHAQGFATEKGEMSMFSLELRLIQSKKDIENPSSILKCEIL